MWGKQLTDTPHSGLAKLSDQARANRMWGNADSNTMKRLQAKRATRFGPPGGHYEPYYAPPEVSVRRQNVLKSLMSEHETEVQSMVDHNTAVANAMMTEHKLQQSMCRDAYTLAEMVDYHNAMGASFNLQVKQESFEMSCKHQQEFTETYRMLQIESIGVNGVYFGGNRPLALVVDGMNMLATRLVMRDGVVSSDRMDPMGTLRQHVDDLNESSYGDVQIVLRDFAGNGFRFTDHIDEIKEICTRKVHIIVTTVANQMMSPIKDDSDDSVVLFLYNTAIRSGIYSGVYIMSNDRFRDQTKHATGPDVVLQIYSVGPDGHMMETPYVMQPSVCGPEMFYV